ncbi:MAG: histidine phosphatase family protein [Dehalococcoidia bacterium]
MVKSVRKLLVGPLSSFLIMAAIIGVAPAGLSLGVKTAAAQQAGQTPSGAALVAALQRGGYVILFRHAKTDMSQNDVQPPDLANCQAQRNLDDSGRAQARAIGNAFQSLPIPVGQVVSSRFCRALDTAGLIAGPATPSDDLIEIVTPTDNNGNPRTPTPDTEAQRRTAILKQLLATRPATGTNTILVSHGSNIMSATSLMFQEGDAGVFLPGGDGTFTLVARVGAAEWSMLAQPRPRSLPNTGDGSCAPDGEETPCP